MTNIDSKEDLLPRYKKEHGSEPANTYASINWLSDLNNRVDNSSFVNKSKTLKKVKRKVHILYALIFLTLMLFGLFVRIFALPQYAVINNSGDQSFVPQNIDYKPNDMIVTQENVMMNDDEKIKDSKINMEKAKEMLYQTNTKESNEYNNAKKESLHKGNDIKALKQSNENKKEKQNKKQNNEQNSNDPPFRKSQHELDKQISNGKL